MSDSLGKFSIDLEAKITSLETDLGRAQRLAEQSSRAMQKSFEDGFKRTEEAIRGSMARISDLITAGISIDAVVELTKQALEAANHVEDLSQSIGAGVKTIQTLSYAAGVSGASLDIMTGALEKSEKTANDAAHGNVQAAEAFRAIGISASEVAQLMKDPDRLIQVVTQHLSQFADGSGKTAVTLQIMGRGAAQNIPLINRLGESFADLQQKAQAAGIVLSDDETHALARAQQGFNEIDQDVKGLANRFALDLVPAIELAQGEFTAFVESDSVKTGLQFLGAGLENAVTHMRDIREIGATLVAGGLPSFLADAATEAGHLAFQSGIVYDVFAKIRDVLPTLSFDWIKTAESKIKNLGAQAAAAIASGFNSLISGSDSAGWAKLQIQIDAALKKVTEDSGEAGQAVDEFGLHLRDSGRHADEAKKPLVDYNSQIESTQRAAKAYAADIQRLTNLEDQLASGLGGPYLGALKIYQKGVDELANTWSDAVDAGKADDALIARLSKDGEDLEKQLVRTNAQIRAQHDALGDSTIALRDQISVMGIVPEKQDAVRAGLEAYNKALKDHFDLEGNYIEDDDKLRAALAKQLPLFVSNKQAVHDLTEEERLNRQAARDWINVWQSAGDQFVKLTTDVLFEGKSLFGGLKDLAKSTVESMVQYFERLAIINPILNAVFGGSMGFSLLPTLGSAATSGALGGSGIGGAAGDGSGGGDLFGTASGGISLFNAGKTLFSGFSSAYSSFMYGSGQTLPFASYLGSSVYGPGMATSFAPSALGWGASIAGGAYAGYQRYQNRYNTGTGIAGGLTYGLGTTALGLGMAGVATGAGFSAGVGALGALGPIGWIALAAMLVDMVSGGKLFGTAGKVVGGNQTVSIGAGGADVSTNITTKGQKPLFGGSYWKEHSVATDPAIQEAWDEFFAGVTTGLKNYATQYGAKIPDIIASSFQQTFDKKGNITGSTTTIGGHTYSGESAQQYQQRVVDESELSVLDQFDSKLDATIDKYRANVDVLTGLVSGLSTAETMFQAGENFLALGTDQSLSSLVNLAAGTMQFGETIDQALARIEQAQAAYDQFVGQFKKVNYVDDFEAAMSGIKTSLIANIKQANDLAKAAGAAGASTKDLANIYAYAAQQEADALRQLEQSAQSLAFTMGLTTVGSLDQVTSEIQRLQQKANTVVQPLHGVGDAMNAMAQHAIAAMNLLLGNDSPYNDLQKLQFARQGLIAGTVTSQQYDDIARRLFGSSNRYFQEFQFAQQFAGRDAANLGAGVAGGHKQGLNASDSQRLQELLKEQQDLQKANDLTNAQTLAQQIAEIAAVKGEDYKQVAADMHLDLAGLEKRLNMSDDAFAKYIKDIQSKEDTAGENTKSIVSAIYDIGNQITVALGGTPTDRGDGTDGSTDPGHSGHALPGHAPTPHPGAPPPPPTGHGGHALPPHGVTREGATMIGDAVARAQNRPGGSNQRPRVRIA